MPPAQRPCIFLIDAMGFIFRAYYAPIGPDVLRNARGVPTKVPYIFATMVRRLLNMKELRADYIGVAFDRPEPTFRDKLFAQYKAQRPAPPADLFEQIPYVRRYCEAMRMPIIEAAGYEADDVIGALARQAVAQGMDVIIVTSDKDMLQLVGGPVRVLIPTKGDLLVDEVKVIELLGVPPARVPDIMALMGDTIDNIPGAKGIGEKGARDLIIAYGTVEAALEHAAEVKGKRQREALETQGEQVRLSKQLATIACDAPVMLDLGALALRPPDETALRELYTELSFTSLLRDLAPPVSTETTDYQPLADATELRDYLNSLPASESVAIWLEPVLEKGEDVGYGTSVARIEISSQHGVARFAAVDRDGKMLDALRTWLEDPGKQKIVHDPKTLELLATGSPALPSSGLVLAGVRDAAMLHSFLLLPTTATHDIGHIAVRHLGVTLSQAPGEKADFLFRTASLLRREVESRGMLQVYEEIDLPLAAVLARMEREGVRVDPAALQGISSHIERELARLQKQIFECAGFEFNINSPQQLAEVLFDKLNLAPLRKRSAAKARSTAADVLEELAPLHALPRHVLEYRELAKIKSTYADTLPALVHPGSGRLHTSLSQTGAATGRLSSSNPNLQNIPVRTELGREIRAAFVAAAGNTLLSADYSQIELRLLAHFSADPVLVDAFRRGEDIHARTAQEVFGVPPPLQNKEHRRAAKVINFGIVYGLSAFGLAQNLGIGQKEAARFIAAYFERYRGVKDYLDQQVAETRKTGVTRTLFGRIRPIPEINSPQPAMRNFAERTAMNTPLQGTAADIIKLAMIDIDRRLIQKGMRSKMILQVHDELLFEMAPRESSELRSLVRQAMEHAYGRHGPLLVPLVVDLKAGPNWRDME